MDAETKQALEAEEAGKMMTYTVYQQGCPVMSFRREQAAIAHAEALAKTYKSGVEADGVPSDLIQVVAVEKSGTYSSTAQIWPTQSATFAR